MQQQGVERLSPVVLSDVLKSKALLTDPMSHQLTMTVQCKPPEPKPADKTKLKVASRVMEGGQKAGGPSVAKRPKLQYHYDPSGVIDLSAKTIDKPLAVSSTHDNGTLDLSVKRHSPCVPLLAGDIDQPLDFSCHAIQPSTSIHSALPQAKSLYSHLPLHALNVENTARSDDTLLYRFTYNLHSGT